MVPGLEILLHVLDGCFRQTPLSGGLPIEPVPLFTAYVIDQPRHQRANFDEFLCDRIQRTGYRLGHNRSRSLLMGGFRNLTGLLQLPGTHDPVDPFGGVTTALPHLARRYAAKVAVHLEQHRLGSVSDLLVTESFHARHPVAPYQINFVRLVLEHEPAPNKKWFRPPEAKNKSPAVAPALSINVAKMISIVCRVANVSFNLPHLTDEPAEPAVRRKSTKSSIVSVLGVAGSLPVDWRSRSTERRMK